MRSPMESGAQSLSLLPGCVENGSMEASCRMLVDAGYGIEYRAVENANRHGWIAQWRPLRALKKFMTFSFITRSEVFASPDEAIDFVRRNVAEIVAGKV